jgi:predicted RNA-binding protein YlxR (DUF448 family)
MKDKRELTRIVRDKEGGFFIDHTGKKPGRGAYICPGLECIRKAVKHKGFERSFKQAVPSSILEQLEANLSG